MQKKTTNADLVVRAVALAGKRANDAVKLAFMDEGQVDSIKKMDLSLVSEIKRSDKGAIEIKLINKLEILKFIATLLGDSEGAAADSSGIFAALDRAAERLGERGSEV